LHLEAPMSKSVWHVQLKVEPLTRHYSKNTSELLIAETLESAIEIVKNKHPSCTILSVNHRGQLTIEVTSLCQN